MIAAGLVTTGLALQLSIGSLEWRILAQPANKIAIGVLLLMQVAAYLLRSRVYLFRFVKTAAAAVPALCAAVGVTLIMGLTRQAAEPLPGDVLGLTMMLNSWPFILTYVWLIFIVGEVALSQLHHFSWKRLPSTLSHIGLWIAVVCGTLGSADMQRLKMYCEEGQPEWRGLNEKNDVVELPLAIQLNKFSIKEYAPKLMVIDAEGKPLPHGQAETWQLSEGVKTGALQGWTLTLEQYIEDAAPAMMAKMTSQLSGGMMDMVRMDSLGAAMNRDGYVEYAQPGGACAVKVKAVRGSESREGWITCGSYKFPYQALQLADGQQLVMGNREPEKYESEVMLFSQTKNESQLARISVNEPVELEGWKIYQYSFNEQMGKWSTLSVFELVRDPWLPAVYTGIGLMLLGAILMFLFAQRR